jgi:hypothetical protein
LTSPQPLSKRRGDWKIEAKIMFCKKNAALVIDDKRNKADVEDEMFGYY